MVLTIRSTAMLGPALSDHSSGLGRLCLGQASNLIKMVLHGQVLVAQRGARTL